MGSEVWGANAENDFIKLDKICIYILYLGVIRKASNQFASRGELGKFPLLISILKRTLDYLNHLNQLSGKTIAKQAFLHSKEPQNEGKESHSIQI